MRTGEPVGDKQSNREGVRALASALLAQGRTTLMDTSPGAPRTTDLLILAMPDAALSAISDEITATMARVQGLCDDAMHAGEPPARIMAITVMRFPGSR